MECVCVISIGNSHMVISVYVRVFISF